MNCSQVTTAFRISCLNIAANIDGDAFILGATVEDFMPEVVVVEKLLVMYSESMVV